MLAPTAEPKPVAFDAPNAGAAAPNPPAGAPPKAGAAPRAGAACDCCPNPALTHTQTHTRTHTFNLYRCCLRLLPEFSCSLSLSHAHTNSIYIGAACDSFPECSCTHKHTHTFNVYKCCLRVLTECSCTHSRARPHPHTPAYTHTHSIYTY